MKQELKNPVLRKLLAAKNNRKSVTKRRDPNGMSYENWESQQ